MMPMMMKSIQGRLIFAITITCAVFLSATGLLLYHSMSSHLTRQFDRDLSAEAGAVASFVNQHPNGTLDFDYNESAMPEYRSAPHRQYFVIRFHDGRVFARSSSGNPANASVAATASLPLDRAEDLTLPSGRAGRAVRIEFVPPVDSDDKPRPTTRPAPAKAMTIVMARDRGMLDSSLHHIFWRLVIGLSLLALVTAAAVAWIVRGSLRPLRAVAERAAEIDAARLHLRLPTEGLPTELTPICSCLNDLLLRLDHAFARERRFTSDVAHELRTPIAELRTTVDVALRWPDDAGATRHALRESQQIAVQMQTLVQTLLDLVRAERVTRLALAPIPLLDAVARAVRATETLGVEKGVTVEIPDYVTVMAEPTLLGSVLANVLSNALEYSDGEEPIRCRAHLCEGGWLLTIENRATQLTAQDVRHMRDPFWRKDAARTSSSMHTGLGLALVDSFCRLMNIRVDVELRAVPPPQTFVLRLTFAGGPPRTSPPTQDDPSSAIHLPPVGYVQSTDGS
jgi:signal transduction histidine kinase